MANRSTYHSFPIPHIFIILGGILIFNIIAIDIWIIHSIHSGIPLNVLGESTDTCPQSCISRINQLTGSKTTATKENYVPLGSGTSTAREWTDVPGAQAYIDTASYGKIKTATFEATVQVPNGSQITWVRLFNATDKHPVWFSDITLDSSGPTLLTSAPITLDPGKKLYIVQLKSQLGSQTQILQARVKINTL